MNDITAPDLPAARDTGAGLDDAERTRCEVWTRVMGYHRPVASFNTGKKGEHRERRFFSERPSGRASVSRSRSDRVMTDEVTA